MRRRNLVGFGAGPIVSAGLGLLTVPVIAWTFPPEDVGRYSLYQAVLTLTLLVSTLGLDQAFTREYHEHAQAGGSDASLLTACAVPGLLTFGVIVAIAAPLASGTAQALYGTDTSAPALTWLTLCALLLSFVLRYQGLVLRMEERGLAYSVLEFVQRGAFVLALAAVAIGGRERRFSTLLALSVGALAVATAIAAWSTRGTWRRLLEPASVRPSRGALFALALPLGVSSIAYWGLSGTAVLAVRHWSTLEELGRFGLTVSVSNAAAILQAMVTVVWAPVVYRWVASEAPLDRIDDVAERVLAVVYAAFVAAALAAPLLDWILPPEYADIKYLLPCAVAPPLLYTLSEITGVGITVSRRTMLSVWVTLGAFALAIVAALTLVPALGARGAVVGNSVAFMAFFVARTEAASRAWRPIARRKAYVATGALVSLAIITALAGARRPQVLAAAWMAAGGIGAIGFRKAAGALADDLRGLVRR